VAHALLALSVTTLSFLQGVYMPNEHERHEAIDTTQRQLPDRERVKSDAAEVLGKTKEAGQQQLESGRQAAVNQAEKVAAVIEEASSQFKQNDLQTLANYASEIGSTIKGFSENLHNRSIDDLVKDIQGIARRNPTALLLGSVAIGVAISRFFKASAERQHGTSRRSDTVEPLSTPDF
jgi:hypothetical protein